MINLDIQVGQRLTQYYLAALMAVALLTFVGQVLIQRSMTEILGDARVINLAGRQRMLSQRLTKRAVLLCNPQVYPAGTNSYILNFDQQLQLWYQCHQGIRQGFIHLNNEHIKVQRSPKLDSLLVLIQPIFRQMYGSFKLIEQQVVEQRNISRQSQQALEQILKVEQRFIELMNAYVFEYDIETKQRVDRVRNTEFMLAVLTFVVLFLEGVFIFRPIATYVQAVIKQLLSSEAKLRISNEQLQQSNQTLMATQAELLKTNEEKLAMQIHEGKVRSVSLMEGQEKERQRLSRELHDGIGQMLTALKLQVEKIDSRAFATPQQKHVEDLRKLVQETIEATRTVAFNLMPSVLSDFGVVAAIKLLAEQTTKSAGINLVFNHEGKPYERFAEQIEIGVYRIAQEALNNALKHAQATQISVRLSTSPSYLSLSVEDNGVGFGTRRGKTHKQGNGLSNMKTRAELLNGTCKVSTKAGHGTTILVYLPIKPNIV